MGVENKESCSQRDSAEHKGYVRARRSFNRIWKERDSAETDILVTRVTGTVAIQCSC